LEGLRFQLEGLADAKQRPAEEERNRQLAAVVQQAMETARDISQLPGSMALQRGQAWGLALTALRLFEEGAPRQFKRALYRVAGRKLEDFLDTTARPEVLAAEVLNPQKSDRLSAFMQLLGTDPAGAYLVLSRLRGVKRQGDQQLVLSATAHFWMHTAAHSESAVVRLGVSDIKDTLRSASTSPDDIKYLTFATSVVKKCKGLWGIKAGQTAGSAADAQSDRQFFSTCVELASEINETARRKGVSV
jgi:hypothetical protein